MTSEDLKELDNLMSNDDVLERAERYCNENGFDPETDYPQTETSEVMKSPARAYVYIGSVIPLFRRSFYLMATKEELIDIAKYIMTLRKSVDSPVDFRKCEADSNISDLGIKYPMSDFLMLDMEEVRRRHAEREND